MYQSVIN